MIEHHHAPDVIRQIREVVANLNAAGVPATVEGIERLCEPAPRHRLPCFVVRKLRPCEQAMDSAAAVVRARGGA